MHFRVLEFWRLAAALAVMTFHYLRYAPAEIRAAEEILYRLLPLMDMFFMISGFLIMLRYGDSLLDGAGTYRRFIGRRFARIYPIYLVTLVFFVGIGIAVNMGYVHSGWEGRFDFSKLPHNILLIQGWGGSERLTFNYVAWTLSAEWFCYLVFPVIVLAFQRGGALGLIMLTAATIALLHAASVNGLIPEGNWLRTYTFSAYRAFADFSLGSLIAVLMRSSGWRLQSHLPGWLVFSVSIIAMLNLQDAYLVLALLALAIFLASLAERNNPTASFFLKPLAPIGAVSFGIYMLHPIVEVLFFSLLWRMVVEPLGAIGYLTYWYLPMAAAIVLALASDRWFERPVGKIVVGWFEGGRSDRGQRSAIEPAE